MKRAWIKKVESFSSCKVSLNALEGQLKPQPKVKVRRVFRTSAALIGLTVVIGTPNLLLAQAAQLPEKISSAAPLDDASPETVQQVIPQVALQTTHQNPVETVTVPIYSSPAPVIQYIPEINSTPELPQDSGIVPQAPIVNKNVRAILRQHQQATSLEQTPAVAPSIAIAPVIANPTEVAPTENPTQIDDVASSPIDGRSQVTSEVNSAWTAKQRLLIDRIKNKENPGFPNNIEAVQAAKDIELAPPLATISQPPALSTPVVAAPNLEPTLLEARDRQTSVVEATSGESMELEAQLPTEATVAPETQPSTQEAINPVEAASPSPAITVASPLEPLPPTVAQINTPSIAKAVDEKQVAIQDTPEVVEKAVEEQQVAIQDTPEVVENPTPAPEKVARVNEPIIVSATTSEYQVKPGDTLTNIASEHRLSLPEVAQFNQLSNPDLLLVDQKIKLPSLSSITAQTNVAILPPIENAKANSLPVAAQSSSNKVVLVSSSTPAPAYTGVGGSIEGEEMEAKPLEPTALNNLQTQYAANLQNDVQKLRQKYYAQNSSQPIMPVQAVKGEVLQAVIKPRLALDDEPVNPEFRVAQASQDLKPVPQKQLLDKVEFAPNITNDRVATAKANASNSEEFFPAQQVTPELPPLAPALNYLPETNHVAPLNGYIWPARGTLTSKYGYRWGRMHRGIDIAAPVGTPIFAVAPGVVIKSGWNKGGYGNLVDIQHSDGTLTRYAHNYRLLVQPGQFVAQGQQISLMGSTGRSTGPHLHFELHPGGKGAINPIALLPKVR